MTGEVNLKPFVISFQGSYWRRCMPASAWSIPCTQLPGGRKSGPYNVPQGRPSSTLDYPNPESQNPFRIAKPEGEEGAG